MAKRPIKIMIDDWALPLLEPKNNHFYLPFDGRYELMLDLFETLKKEGYNRDQVSTKAVQAQLLKYGASTKSKNAQGWKHRVEVDIAKAISTVYGQTVIGITKDTVEKQEIVKQRVQEAASQAKDRVIAEDKAKKEAQEEIEKARYKEFKPSEKNLEIIKETFGDIFSTEPGKDEDIL
jgi:hypothetical protein